MSSFCLVLALLCVHITYCILHAHHAQESFVVRFSAHLCDRGRRLKSSGRAVLSIGIWPRRWGQLDSGRRMVYPKHHFCDPTKYGRGRKALTGRAKVRIAKRGAIRTYSKCYGNYSKCSVEVTVCFFWSYARAVQANESHLMYYVGDFSTFSVALAIIGDRNVKLKVVDIASSILLPSFRAPCATSPQVHANC